MKTIQCSVFACLLSLTSTISLAEPEEPKAPKAPFHENLNRYRDQQLRRREVVPDENEAKQIRELIQQLDADSFSERGAASRELSKMGMKALPAMKAAIDAPVSREQQRRLEGLIQSLGTLFLDKQLFYKIMYDYGRRQPEVKPWCERLKNLEKALRETKSENVKKSEAELQRLAKKVYDLVPRKKGEGIDLNKITPEQVKALQEIEGPFQKTYNDRMNAYGKIAAKTWGLKQLTCQSQPMRIFFTTIMEPEGDQLGYCLFVNEKTREMTVLINWPNDKFYITDLSTIPDKPEERALIENSGGTLSTPKTLPVSDIVFKALKETPAVFVPFDDTSTISTKALKTKLEKRFPDGKLGLVVALDRAALSCSISLNPTNDSTLSPGSGFDDYLKANLLPPNQVFREELERLYFDSDLAEKMQKEGLFKIE